MVFVISVNEITLALNFTYDEIATKKFGAELIVRVKVSMLRDALAIATRKLEKANDTDNPT